MNCVNSSIDKHDKIREQTKYHVRVIKMEGGNDVKFC